MGVNSNSRQCQTSSEWPTLSLSIWQLDHAHSNPSCQTSRYSEPASDLYWGLVSLTKSYFRYPQDSMMGHHGDWPDIRKRQVGYHDLATNSNHSLTYFVMFQAISGPLKITMGATVLSTNKSCRYHLYPIIHIICPRSESISMQCRRDFTHPGGGGRGRMHS